MKQKQIQIVTRVSCWNVNIRKGDKYKYETKTNTNSNQGFPLECKQKKGDKYKCETKTNRNSKQPSFLNF